MKRSLVDVTTGEVVSVRVPRVRRGQTPYIQVFQEPLKALVQQDVLTLREWRVLLLVLATMTWGNRVVLTQRQMGELIGLDRSHVSRALTTLKRLGLLVPTPALRGQAHTYEVSPTLAYMGTMANLAWKRLQQTRQPSLP